MQKRFMPFIFREIGLLCRRNVNQYLMFKAEKNTLTIPKIVLSKEENFEETIKRYFSSLDLDFEVKGIAKINLGNDGSQNFYRCTYFVQLNQKQEIKSEQLLFLKYQKQTAGNIQFQVRELIEQIRLRKKIANSDLFRENFKQQEPRIKSLRTLIDI